LPSQAEGLKQGDDSGNTREGDRWTIIAFDEAHEIAAIIGTQYDCRRAWWHIDRGEYSIFVALADKTVSKAKVFSSRLSEGREWEQDHSSGHAFKPSYSCVEAGEPEMLGDMDGDS
jgi:hypothetical protein